MCLRDSMDDRLVALLEGTHTFREAAHGGKHTTGLPVAEGIRGGGHVTSSAASWWPFYAQTNHVHPPPHHSISSVEAFRAG